MAVDEFSDYPDTGARGSQEYTSPQDPSIDFTSKNPRGDYEPPQPDVDYGVGATGNVSTSGRTSSDGGSGGTGAPFIHPFKIQKFINPDDNSTRVRIYEGDVYARIDTFKLALISITTRDQSYSTADPPAGPETSTAPLGNHSITFSDVTAQMPQHQHDVDGGAVFIPQHKHLPRDSSEDGLVMPNHKHAAGSNLKATVAEHIHSSQGTVSGTDQKLTIKQHKHLPRDSSEDGLVMPNHKHQYNKDDHSHVVAGHTASGSPHTHSLSTLSVPMEDHYHKSGEESGTGTAAAGQQLKLRHHTHSLTAHTHPLTNITTGGPTSGSGSSSGGSYGGSDSSHTHDLGGNTGSGGGGSTGDVDDFGVDDSGNLAPEDITGNTGGIGTSFPDQQISGTLPLESSHTHPISLTAAEKTGNDITVGDTKEVTDYDTVDSDTGLKEKHITGETGSVKDYNNNDNNNAEKKCTGTTGDVRVGSSAALPPFTISVSGGSSSSSSGLNHKHKVPALENTNSQTHKFVAVTGQDQAPLGVDTNFTDTFNKAIQFEDGTDSIFRFHESPHSSGDFYVKWVITINPAAVVQTIVGSIERVAAGAGAPADISFGALNQDDDDSRPTFKKLSRTNPTFSDPPSNDPSKLVGTFHQKIGSVSGNNVDQVQFSNINWSMTVLPEVS